MCVIFQSVAADGAKHRGVHVVRKYVGGNRKKVAHLGSRGASQRVQQPLHDYVVPDKCQSSVMLHHRGDDPAVERVEQSRSAGTAAQDGGQHDPFGCGER